MTETAKQLQKEIEVVTITPPPHEERVMRAARFYPKEHPRDRYALPESLSSYSPIAYRSRVQFSKDEMMMAGVKTIFIASNLSVTISKLS